MGNFFTNYHISLKDASKKDTIAIFEDFMKKRGYERSNSEDESTVSFMLYESNDWASFVTIDEENTKSSICDEFLDYTLSLGGSGLSVECVDSDFAVLRFQMKKKVDTSLVIGRPYYEEMKESSNTNEWKDAIADTSSLSRITSENYIFVEDGLEEVGKLLGMNEGQILISQDNYEDPKCTLIGFNRSAKGKSKSFRTLFKEIFGEGLKDDGFVPVKGNQPYIVRMVGDELFHVISYQEEWCGEKYNESTKGWKRISILGSVGTVYRKKISLDIPPKQNREWLFSLCEFYVRPNPTSYDMNLRKSKSWDYLINPKDECQMRQSLEESLSDIHCFMIPVLNSISTVEKCVDFHEIFHSQIARPTDYKEEGGFISSDYTEGLLFVKEFELGMVPYRKRTELETELALMDRAGITYSKESFVKEYEECIKKDNRIIKKIISNDNLTKKALEIINNNKRNNLQLLQKYGIVPVE